MGIEPVEETRKNLRKKQDILYGEYLHRFYGKMTPSPLSL